MSRMFDDYYFDSGEYLIDTAFWVNIPDYPDYLICEEGYIYSLKTDKILKPHIGDKQGHMTVRLMKNGEVYEEYIHRLVAKTFIRNPEHYPIVRHLDDDRNNNSVDNLEWGTQKDNHRDAVRNKTYYELSDKDRERHLSKQRTPIIGINLDTGEEIYFRSQAEASRYLKIPQANIYKVLNHERRHAKGYVFRYEGGDFI